MNSDIKYLIALSHFPKFGPVRLRKLIQFFPNNQTAFQSDLNGLLAAGIDENSANEFLSARPKLDPDSIMENIHNEKVNFVSVNDPAYPALLKEIYSPPPLLYYKGSLSNADKQSLAVVGTRKHSAYGKRVTDEISFELAKNNISVISGLALGIDAIAHLATVRADGRTVGVLATGLDKQSIYPSSNRYIAEKIINSGGMIMSEFPLGTPPLKHHFPQRNRLISGMSLGTLVIEAGEKSGALITAYHALEQNREIFAVPGSIHSPMSIGPHKLVKRGATLVTNANDILDALDLAQAIISTEVKRIIPENNDERSIIDVLSHEPKHIDELVRATKLDTSRINSTLLVMEMKGMVKNLGNSEYVLA